MSLRKFRLYAQVMGFAMRAFFIRVRDPDPFVRHKDITLNFQRSARAALKTLNIKVEINDPHEILTKQESYLVLGNHCSYLDMLILCAHFPVIFVSSVERRDDGLLGLVAKLAGTLFVDRINKSKIHSDIDEISTYLKKNISICLYLEGTTGNGMQLLPFKSSLLRAIEGKSTKVLPICLRYTKLNNEPIMDSKLMDTIAWYGDAPFFSHLQRLCQQQSITAELNFLPIFQTTETMTRKEITTRAKDIIEAKFLNKQGLGIDIARVT